MAPLQVEVCPSIGEWVCYERRAVDPHRVLFAIFFEGAVWWCCFHFRLYDDLLFLRLFMLELASSTVCQVLLKDSMGKDRNSDAANKECSHHRNVSNCVSPAD
jgi:hypothetical protein